MRIDWEASAIVAIVAMVGVTIGALVWIGLHDDWREKCEARGGVYRSTSSVKVAPVVNTNGSVGAAVGTQTVEYCLKADGAGLLDIRIS